VLTLYLSTSSAEYYDWEDAMEDFLWDRGLESCMKIFFAWHTFSASVLQWWIKLQEGLINRGEDPCQTWKGMKLVLQRQFDLPIEHPVPKINKIAATSERNILLTLSRMYVHRGVTPLLVMCCLHTHMATKQLLLTLKGVMLVNKN
jgi:hypothetical protein